MTYVRVDRDSTGNVTGGTLSFNVKYNMGGPVTFNGWHIHNGKIGVNGPVVINTGLGGSDAVVTPANGNGSISRDVNSSSSDNSFDYLRGVIESPENYYVNLHSTTFPNGVIRAQLAKETYRYKTNMSPSNEVPPITTVDTAVTGWITGKISRDANGTINGGDVTFDMDYTNTGAITFNGLHIHHPGVSGVNTPVIINTGLSGSNTIGSATGSGNITRRVTVASTSAAGLAALNARITAPDTAYVNIDTTIFPNGVARSQMFPIANTVAQIAGGGDWITNITIRNPSATASVQGILDLFQSNGSLFPAANSDPNISYVIPPASALTFSTHNKGDLTTGFAKVFSNGNVTVDARFIHSQFTPGTAAATTVTSHAISVPVLVGGSNQNTGIALIANTAGPLTLTLTVNGPFGPLDARSRTMDVAAGQQISAFVSELLPSVRQSQYAGTLTVAASAGTVSALALQFSDSVSPVTVTSLP
jgi:hypothetical protein